MPLAVRNGGQNGQRTVELTVRSVLKIADETMALVLENDPLPAWEPGAHIDLVLENGLVGQYSLW